MSGPHRQNESASAVLTRAALATLPALLAVVIRIVPPWSEVVEGAIAVVRDPDACYHLRRAALMAENFPDLALFDSYVNFPSGAHVIWPPFYDLTLSLLSALFPAAAGAPGPDVAVALLPPLLFGLTVLVIFLLARRLWPRDPWSPSVAAGVAAVLPASLPYTALAQLDHHAAELLMIALFLLALTGALCGGGAQRPAWRRAVWPAAALAAALGTQLSLVVLIGVAAAALILIPSEGRASRLELGAWLFGGAFLLLLPWGLLYSAAGAPLRHYQFGLFQPGLLLVAALGALAARLGSGGARGPRLLGAAIAVLAAVWIGSRLFGEAMGGATYLARSFSTWQQDIGESQPLWIDGWGAGARVALGRLSPLILLLPIAWLRLAVASARGDSRRGVILAASLLFAALALLQQRFLPHLALLVGITAIVATEPLLRFGAPAARRAAGLALILLLGLLPLLTSDTRPDAAAVAFDESRSVLSYLAEETEPTSFYDAPMSPPEYGVLAEWSYGHFIQYHGRRPAVIDNFGDHAGDPARVRALFLSEDEARAAGELDSLGVRYLLLRDLPSTFEGLVPDDATRRRYVAGAVLAGGRGTVRFTPAMTRTILYRLAWWNGSGVPGETGVAVPPLARLRLVAESEELEDVPGGPPVARVKLYEVVKGARLTVRGCEPGEEGVLLATVRSPRGRRFPYIRMLSANGDGAMEAIIPYPTESAPGRSRLESASVRTRSGSVDLPAIIERDLRLGAEVACKR